jgi:hypothetical protein
VVDVVDLSNCKEKVIVLEGNRFVLDERTGYYRCNKLRKRLHQYVWEKNNGKIPKGYHIHHVDHNKKNNNIDNLIAISHKEHALHHESEREKEEEHKEWRKKNFIEKVIPKAREWHKSDEGRKWHSQQAKEQAKLREEKTFTCDHCEKEFTAWNTSKNRFCSNKCKSAWRRKQGLDNETRKCEHCDKEYEVNKYSKKRFCSVTCSNRAIPRLPQYKD